MGHSESREVFDRINRAKNSKSESSDSPDNAVWVCPIEGCSRTIINDPSSLRSHVRQAGDDAHRFRTLNEDLNIEVNEEQYHSEWGPGVREGREMANSISASAAVVDW